MNRGQFIAAGFHCSECLHQVKARQQECSSCDQEQHGIPPDLMEEDTGG